MAGVVLPQAATRLRKLILEDAWRSGQRRTPATILLAISTAMTTMLVVAAFLWYLVIIFTPWYNGTTIIAPLMFPTAGLAMLSLGVVSTPRFLGSLTINIIGVALSVLSFVCVLLQVPLMWPGIFDGVAGVPCALAAVAAWYFAWAWGDVAQACAAPASEYCTRPEPHAYFAASRDATCRALAARCQLSVPALAVRALLADALFTPKHVALALLHLALDVWPLWALLALVLAAAVAVRATFHALTDGPRSLVRLLSADKGE